MFYKSHHLVLDLSIKNLNFAFDITASGCISIVFRNSNSLEFFKKIYSFEGDRLTVYEKNAYLIDNISTAKGELKFIDVVLNIVYDVYCKVYKKIIFKDSILLP